MKLASNPTPATAMSTCHTVPSDAANARRVRSFSGCSIEETSGMMAYATLLRFGKVFLMAFGNFTSSPFWRIVPPIVTPQICGLGQMNV